MKSTYKYFPVNEAQKEWGLYATCAGHSVTKPHAEFPSPAHPDQYFFSWQVGRVLHEWQLILVEEGGGTVEFRQRHFRARSGSLIILAPECWHRYKPNPKTGWTTLWVGFGGDLASRLIGSAGFNPEGEVLNLKPGNAFHRMLQNVTTAILENGHANVYTAAARIPMLVASLIETSDSGDPDAARGELVHRAQMYIADHAAETVDFDALASSLGISYRSFRYLFAKETGDPPLKYQLGIRLARAKNLLASSKMPVSEIARTLGFNSTWYFSHFFRAQTGISAAAYRRRHAGHAAAVITPSTPGG